MNEPDCEDNVWEISKENVQPLRSGRSAVFLKAALQSSQEHIKCLANERRQFEEGILAGENTDDPIGPWDKYLKWTRQNFPIGENKTTLESILRKFISKFMKHDEYKNDPRYINAWILLAQTSDNPENIFSYMKGEGFGLQCASFYVAWADELEKCGNVKRAASIYRFGEENNAQPFVLLQKMKNAFEMRSARKAVTSIGRDCSPTVSETASEMKPLNNLTVKKRLPFSINKQQFNSSSKTTNQKSSLSIFEDFESSSKPVGKWVELPDSVKINKENTVIKPSTWKMPLEPTRIRHSRHQPGRGFAIFEEPKLTRFGTPSNKIANPGQENSKLAKSSAEADFEIFDDDQLPSTIAATPSARKVSKTIERVLSESKRSLQTKPILEQVLLDCNLDNDSNISRQYPFDKIYSVMGELQFEEVIAAEKRIAVRK